MNKRKGQVSVEYIMIIVISLMILIPGTYVFRNFVFESNDDILNQRLTEVSNQILSRSRKIHYFGPPSRSVVEIEMPPSIDNMYIMSVPDNTQKNEYYLAYTLLTTKGPIQKLFLSDIPIRTGENITCLANLYCQANCDCFPMRYYSKGIKNIRARSVYDPLVDQFYIEIKEISNDQI